VKVLKAITSSLLAMLVLISSMGFFVDHMVCGMSGEHKLAINTSIDSCSDTCDRDAENEVKRTCCDYESNYFQEDVPATSSEKKVKQTFSAFKFVPLREVFALTNCTESCCFHLVEQPDVLPSVERHILHETYLI
jgi:hypothetical protein